MIDKDVVFGDFDIRAVLRSRLFLKQSDEADTVVIEELGLCRGQVRVDVVVVNGLLHGYEIKSDRDTLRRLGVQVKVYGKVFDQATLVVGDRHLAEALNIVPAWWGVCCTFTLQPRGFTSRPSAARERTREGIPVPWLSCCGSTTPSLFSKSATVHAAFVASRAASCGTGFATTSALTISRRPFEPSSSPRQRTKALYDHRDVVGGTEPAPNFR